MFVGVHNLFYWDGKDFGFERRILYSKVVDNILRTLHWN